MTKLQITEEYISFLLQEQQGHLSEMEKYAQQNNVPIMESTGMQTLLQIIMLKKPANILEIGAAIGYSAIRMGIAVPNATIVTIERDESRIIEAKKNIEKVSMNEQIHLVEGDALKVVEKVAKYAPYDVLFIDAAKGQYEQFFELYEPYVNIGGLIISDNVLFKGMVAGETEIHSKRLKPMINKLRRFNEKMMSESRFTSMIYPIGDGVMVSIKNSKCDE
ncbi:O-methyltransferase [Evansella cellulosilytica]|uniref:tRNA 5-hydroxyuridine methyltransferase n=1 Tax=Evansella cellulosilytica (strain ATCC 21833 / DSM 2522 / FERM P-1141 / JCM 9156 / N-4) TaxID=649639 RepID=E6TVB0_EVAC2|nr:O-methyltransferase [Evansella cellulosilytica]ADU29794.1 O-methyltransferase family 3 [Evansella cellulosilytica DSM 2522]